MKEALNDTLADSEFFLMQMSSIPTDDSGTPYPHCHLASQQVPNITFTPENMLLKNNDMIKLCTI